MVSSRLVLKAVMMPLGQTMATGADPHMSTANLCETSVGHVLGPAQVKYQAVQQISSGFLDLLEEKLCAVLTSAQDRGYTQREESHCRQVPLPSLPSASLQWLTKPVTAWQRRGCFKDKILGPSSQTVNLTVNPQQYHHGIKHHHSPSSGD